jgi:hypothetical protein
VGSSATLGTGTAFVGNILASASITVTTGASVSGRLLAMTGAVTLDTNTVTNCVEATTAVTVRSFVATPSASGAMLKWRTASEVAILGYNVYGQVHGKRVKLNAGLIAAKGSSNGASYAFRYRPSKGQKTSTRFWLQAVNLDGSRAWAGAARIASRIAS